jgi:hypothetical protein
MGNFANLAITNHGLDLLTHAQLGAVLIPTKIVIGSGYMPDGTIAAAMTGVVSPVKELPINKHVASKDGYATFGCIYSNADIAETFYFRELAMFCRAEYRNENGGVTQAIDEVLYAYGNAGDTADYMPAYSSGQPIERQIDLKVYIGNDVTVNLTVESGVYVSKSEYDTFVNAVNVTFGNVETYLSYKSEKGHNHDGEYLYPASIEITPPSGEGHGGYIDFHYESADDYTSRLIEGAPGELCVNDDKIMTAANIVAISNVAPVFTDGATYYLHSAIKPTSVCIVQRCASVGGEAIPFATSCTNGQVNIATNKEIFGAININILIINA